MVCGFGSTSWRISNYGIPTAQDSVLVCGCTSAVCRWCDVAVEAVLMYVWDDTYDALTDEQFIKDEAKRRVALVLHWIKWILRFGS